MNPYSIPPLVSAVLFLFLGLFVLSRNLKAHSHIAFSLNCLVTFWWQFTWTILFNIKDPLLALVLVKVGYTGIIFIPITFWHFYVAFLKKEKEYNSVLTSYLIGFIFVLVLWLSNLYISGYYSYFWGYYPKANMLHPAYLAFLFYLDAKCFLLLFSSLKIKVLPIKYQQIKYLIIALFFYNFAASDFLVNYGIEFYPLGFIPILTSLGIIFYAIVTTRLMDIEIIIKKTAVYSFLTALLTGLFISIILLGNSLLGSFLGYNSIWFGTLAAFLVAFLFQPLRDKVQELVDKAFFRARYDYQRILRKYSHALSASFTLLNAAPPQKVWHKSGT